MIICMMILAILIVQYLYNAYGTIEEECGVDMDDVHLKLSHFVLV